MADYEYDIFISYSHRDGAWVTTELLPRLEGAGLRVCIDERDFKIGTPSLVNMENAVDHSRHTLIVLTPAWVESAWTEFESLLIGVADPAGRRRRMLPVMLERCTPPARIAILTYADFTNAGDRSHQFDRLISQLREVGAGAIEPAQDLPPPTVAAPAHGRRARPAMGGDSVGHDAGGAGTLGCLVRDRHDRDSLYVLSDFNALCPARARPRAGDAILQPGRADGGNRARDLIATLARWTEVRDEPGAALTNLSGAIALVRQPGEVSPEIRGRGIPRGVRSPREGQEVFLVGRTTKLARGTVLRTGVEEEIPCPHSQIVDGTRGTGDGSGFFPVLFGDLIETTAMIEQGDCGAVLLDSDNYAIGLAFAGSQEISLFVPIGKVLEALEVELVTEDVWKRTRPIFLT
jgi:hypothetical protein